MRIDDTFIHRAFELTAPPRRRSFGWYFLIGIVLAFLFVPALRGDDLGLASEAMIAIPAAFALGVLGGVASASRRRRRKRAFVTLARESVQLEKWEAAAAALEGGLTRPIHSESDRASAFLSLAAVAERDKNFGSAIEIYKNLLVNRIGEPHQLHIVQMAMTSAKLRNEELTDGIDMLGRLEKMTMPLHYRAVLASIRLYPQVSPGPFADAVENLDELRELVRRYLSTRAGYPYALIAKALHQLGRTDQAERYWKDATMLVRPERLTEELPFLAPLQTVYQAEDRPC